MQITIGLIKKIIGSNRLFGIDLVLFLISIPMASPLVAIERDTYTYSYNTRSDEDLGISRYYNSIYICEMSVLLNIVTTPSPF